MMNHAHSKFNNEVSESGTGMMINENLYDLDDISKGDTSRSDCSGPFNTQRPAMDRSKALVPQPDSEVPIAQIAANDDYTRAIPNAAVSAVFDSKVLIVQWDDVDVRRIATLFSKNGSVLTVKPIEWGGIGNHLSELRGFGAIVHAARSEEVLMESLGSDFRYYTDDEWALIARDDIDNIHCLVRLTQHASTELRVYVKTLWAMCNVC